MKFLLRVGLLGILSIAILTPVFGLHQTIAESGLWFTKKTKTQKLSTLRFGVNAMFPTGKSERFFSGNVQLSDDVGDSNYQLFDTVAAGLSFGYKRQLTDYIAFEYSTSLNFMDPESIFLTADGTSNGERTATENSSFIVSPQTVTLQYIIAPYGKLKPYVGLGYNYTLIYSTGDVPYDNPSGPVVQAGLDWISTESLGMNIDIKQFYWDDFGGNFDDLYERAGFSGGVDSVIEDEQPIVVSVNLNYSF